MYPVDGAVGSCPSTSDLWSLFAATNPLGHLTITFEDDAATQIRGASFVVPANREAWTRAQLSITSFDVGGSSFGDVVQAEGTIDSWHVVPEAGSTALAAVGLSLLATLRRTPSE